MPLLVIPSENLKINVAPGTLLLDALRQNGVRLDAPCGGSGKCGKCRVLADGREVLACRTVIDRDMTAEPIQTEKNHIFFESSCAGWPVDPLKEGCLLSFDIGTTSVVCFLLDGKSGTELAKSSMLNPQVAFGADVVTRIRAARQGKRELLTESIRSSMTELTQTVCAKAGISPEEIGVVSIVGNPAMQQLFLNIDTENLTRPPFAPALTEAQAGPCNAVLPVCPNALLLTVPDISGYVGADTVGCLLAVKQYEQEEITLLVDIGTNSEMVLGNKDRLLACAAAAGPALEGADIRFGMRAVCGAIDHVWVENGEVKFSVIGGGAATGICGSGLIDAVAVGLKLGLINKRGRIQTEDRTLPLTAGIFLTQEDIRRVQLAKGAICAGILLMSAELGLKPEDIQKVYLAGAFGSSLDSENACRIGLLPEKLLDKIEVVNNAAGKGAQMLACNEALLPLSQKLTEKIDFIELAGMESFPKTFAKAMLFREESENAGTEENSE